MVNIIIVGGIRTHYIKINAIQKVLALYPEILDSVNIIYVDAAQHYDYSLTMFKHELGLHFDYQLEHTTKDPFLRYASIFVESGKIFEKIQKEMDVDYVVVMGDVATTLMTAMSATMKGLKVVHIESGVRVGRGNGTEEYYRTAVDHISTLCFASTVEDYNNLLSEGFGERAFLSGDIIFDYIKQCNPSTDRQYFIYGDGNQEKCFDCYKSEYILVSLHHVENLNYNTLQNVFTVVHETGYRSIFIAHPRVKRLLIELGINTYDTIIADYIPYLENLIAIAHSRYIITDSGGIQREAYYYNKRCIVRSDLTIWKPLITCGSNTISSGDIDCLRDKTRWAEQNCLCRLNPINVFGSGNAISIIVNTLLNRITNV